MRGRLAGALLLALLMAPAAAAGTSGRLVTSEPVTARVEGEVEAGVGALLVPVRDGAPVFELVAARATVYEYDLAVVPVERSWVHVPPVRPDDPLGAPGCMDLAPGWDRCATRTYELTDLVATISGAREASVFMMARDEPQRLTLSPADPLQLTPVPEADPRDPPGWGFYTPSYLAWEGMDEVRVEGRFEISLRETLLHLAAAENATTIDTRSDDGERPAGVGAPQRVTLAVLRVEDARWRVRSDSPMEAALHEVRAPDVRAASFRDARGTLGGESVRGETLLLEGRFSLDLRAAASGDEAVVIAELAGDVAGYGGAPLARPPEPPPVLWQAGAAGAFALLLAAALVMRRRRALGDVEERVRRASEAAEEGDAPRALAWTRAALQLAPTSATLHADEGYFLEELGDVEGALAAYERAAARSTDGEADFLAARLLVAVDGDVGEVARRLARALEREPALLLEVEEDEALRPYLRHPEVAARAHGAGLRLR